MAEKQFKSLKEDGVPFVARTLFRLQQVPFLVLLLVLMIVGVASALLSVIIPAAAALSEQVERWMEKMDERITVRRQKIADLWRTP